MVSRTWLVWNFGRLDRQGTKLLLELLGRCVHGGGLTSSMDVLVLESLIGRAVLDGELLCSYLILRRNISVARDGDTNEWTQYRSKYCSSRISQW